jgi:hypothetical protein
MYLGAIVSILSSLYLDYGIYSVDIDRVTSNNFSGVFYFVFVFPVIFIFSSLTSKINLKKIRFDRSVFYFVIFTIFVLLLNYFISPKPYFEEGVTRLNYWENSKAPWLRLIVGNISSFCAVIIGIFYYIDRRKIYIYYFLIYFIYLILIGQKGGALFEVLVYFAFPLSFDLLERFPIRKLIFPILTASILILCVAYFSYKEFNPYANVTDSVIEALLYRILGLQNALTSFSIDVYFFNPSKWTYDINDLSDGMSSIMNDLPNFFDVNRVTQITAGRLTNAFPGILFKFSALLSPLILLIILILFYLDVVIFVNAIRRVDFYFLVIFQLFVMLRSALYMGDLGQFFILSFLSIVLRLIKIAINRIQY